MGQQWVLRLIGSDDELRFQMGSVQAIVFGDGTVWAEPAFEQHAKLLQQDLYGDGYVPSSPMADFMLGSGHRRHPGGHGRRRCARRRRAATTGWWGTWGPTRLC